MRYVKNLLACLLLLFISASQSLTANYQYNLSICAIFKNEAPYLKEWIEFHKIVGVQHFYLFNHQSKDNYLEVLSPYIESGEVELTDWDHDVGPGAVNWFNIQYEAYRTGLDKARGVTKWLAILDSDEYLFPVQKYTMTEFLEDYEEFGGLTVNWQLYGTSNVKSIEPGHLLIEDLILRAPQKYGENTHIKSIVRPERVLSPRDPHTCKYIDGYCQVTPDKVPYTGSFSPVKVDKVRINHYWTRDEHYFNEVKVPRRDEKNDSSSHKRAKAINRYPDKSIHKYLPDLKSLLFSGAAL